jgi:hypothetical protein
LTKNYYANAIYACLYKYKIISKSDDGSVVVNISNLKQVRSLPKTYSELDKIRDFKRNKTLEMDAFFSKTSSFSLKNIAKYIPDNADLLKSLDLTIYANILDFF